MKTLAAVLFNTMIALNILVAQTIEINGIAYSIISAEEPFTVGVTSKTPKYEGHIIIPPSIEYDGVVYSVISIGAFAFYNCIDLISVEIPNSVTSIINNAFRGCTGLTSIQIPGSVESIGTASFHACTGLISIDVASDNNFFTSIDGVLYNKDASKLIRCPEGKSSVEIPASVTIIGESSFFDCKGITYIEIPGSVTSIRDKAFQGCTSLSSMVCNALTPPALEANAFNNVPTTLTLYVPAESVDLYKLADQWNVFTNIAAIQTTHSGIITTYGPTVFPNPFRDKISITGIGDGAIIRVHNTNGYLLRLMTHQNGNARYDLSDLQSGVYIIEVVQNGKSDFTRVLKN